MSDIFLSYAKEDRARVNRLARSLGELGWTVFWDPEVPAGKTWRDVIDMEIKNARCVVVAWSSRSVGSHWVLEEAETGRQRHVLIPILIDNVVPPLGFQTLQTADLSDWDGTVVAPTFARLVSSIGTILGPPPRMAQRPAELESKRKEADKRAEDRQRRRPAKQAARPGDGAVRWQSPALYIQVLLRSLFFGALLGLVFAYFNNLDWNTFSPDNAEPLTHSLPNSIGLGLGTVLALEISELLLKAGLSMKILAFVTPVLVLGLGGSLGNLVPGHIIGTSQIMMVFGVFGCGLGAFAARAYDEGSRVLRILGGLGGAVLGAIVGLSILLLGDNWGGRGSVELYWYSFLSGALPGILLSARETLR